LSALGVTALIQAVIVVLSGSVALAADTVHNFSDALTAVPLWIAFALGTRAATRRYTYGFGRAEDLAGLFVVLMIALSAVVAGYQAVTRLLHPVSAGGSARPPWSPTACTPALTGSPRSQCYSARQESHWVIPSPTRSWVC
jgi:cation diffusion facilitator family transporter